MTNAHTFEYESLNKISEFISLFKNPRIFSNLRLMGYYKCCALLWYRGTYKCEQSYLFTYKCWSKQNLINKFAQHFSNWLMFLVTWYID